MSASLTQDPKGVVRVVFPPQASPWRSRPTRQLLKVTKKLRGRVQNQGHLIKPKVKKSRNVTLLSSQDCKWDGN